MYLLVIWLGCQEVVVEFDLVVVVCVCWYMKVGVVCIFGFGFNVVYYDGEKIKEQCGGLGYVFGDEGVGVDLGKILFVVYLNSDLFFDLLVELFQVYGFDWGEVISLLY